MKRILLIASVLVAACAVSCTKETKVEDAVTIKSDDATVPVEGGVVSIAINSTVAWTAKASESWVTISPSSGEAGDATVKASVLKNGTNDSRTATVTFTAGTKSATYTITQSQLDAMNIATTEYVVEAEGGTVEIPVSANVDYSVIVPDAVDWIHVTSTKGMVDTKITLKVDPTQIYDKDEAGAPTFNADALVRTAKITVAGAGEKQVTIGQKAFVPYFEYEGDLAGLQWSYYEQVPVVFPQEGGTFVINVNTNIDWRAYFSRYDASIDAGVDVMENGWAKLSFDKEASTITIEMDPNDSYFAREDYLYTVGLFDGVEDGNFGGLGWFQQAGKQVEGASAEFVWSKTLSELGIPEGYNRLAYKTYNGDALLVSDGEKVHAISPADGTYWKAITWSIKPTSICSDDAGNVIVAPDYAFESGSTYTVYYAEDVNQEPVKLFDHTADFSGTIGGWRVRGDISNRAVVTGFVGGTRYWAGWEIDKKQISMDNYYAQGTGGQARGPIAVDGDAWTPESGAVMSLGPRLNEGIFYRAYDTDQRLYYLADAYTPNWLTPYNWQMVSEAGAGGNENQNNMAIADYKGKRIMAYTQGFHFDYSVNASIYVLDVTNANDVKPLVTINPTADIEIISDFTGQNSADVLLHPTDECLELYVVNSGRSIIGKYKIVF
ncbi:MAG: hypothetical protein IJG35_10170 [Bacteroidales bacterium]|nr:hypothetical protein [Bacteroidales bacterium]